jgi:hypothetical protein
MTRRVLSNSKSVKMSNRVTLTSDKNTNSLGINIKKSRHRFLFQFRGY